MIETFFCSDHHFGHENILEYEKKDRPFDTIDEMHEVIIQRHNQVVKPNDIVYFLGDFAFGKKNVEFAARLNGRKKLVLGNHDMYESSLYLKYFEKLYGMFFWEYCILSHMPVHLNGLGNRWLLNVHGHLHSNIVTREIIIPLVLHPDSAAEVKQKVPDVNYFNVGLEQNNLYPFHRDAIKERFKLLEG